MINNYSKLHFILKCYFNNNTKLVSIKLTKTNPKSGKQL